MPNFQIVPIQCVAYQNTSMFRVDSEFINIFEIWPRFDLKMANFWQKMAKFDCNFLKNQNVLDSHINTSK